MEFVLCHKPIVVSAKSYLMKHYATIDRELKVWTNFTK